MAALGCLPSGMLYGGWLLQQLLFTYPLQPVPDRVEFKVYDKEKILAPEFLNDNVVDFYFK